MMSSNNNIRLHCTNDTPSRQNISWTNDFHGQLRSKEKDDFQLQIDSQDLIPHDRQISLRVDELLVFP